jgi:hypothetical protein
MKGFLGIAAAALLVCGTAQAQDNEKVKPGTAPTAAVGSEVPDMKGKCADQAQVDTKAPGTEATEAMGSQVPDMKQADASDCPPGSPQNSGTKPNN